MTRKTTDRLSEPHTVHQRDVLTYLIAFTEVHVFRPSIRDIARHFHGDANTTGVHCTLRRLDTRGFIGMRGEDSKIRSGAVVILLKPDGTAFLGFKQR